MACENRTIVRLMVINGSKCTGFVLLYFYIRIGIYSDSKIESDHIFIQFNQNSLLFRKKIYKNIQI